MRFTAFLFCCVVSSTTYAQPSAKFSPPPPAETARARLAISEAFGAETEKAKTIAAKKALAGKMLGVANDAKETAANRWVLYGKCRELALSAGDFGTALQSIDDQSKTFTVMRVDLSIENLEKLAKAAGTSAPKALLEFLFVVGDQAIQGDDFTSATKLFNTGSAVSRHGKDAAVTKRFETRARAANDWSKLFEAAKEPKDDLAMGKFQSFRKNDWIKGLPLLAMSKDEGLASVVKKDLAKPTEGTDRTDLGDAWYELAEKAKSEDRIGMLRRAFWWYRLGVGAVGGVARAKIEGRMRNIFEEVEKEDAKNDRFTMWEGKWAVTYDARFTHEYVAISGGLLYQTKHIKADGGIIPHDPPISLILVRVKNGVESRESGKLVERFSMYAPDGIKSERTNPVFIGTGRISPMPSTP